MKWTEQDIQKTGLKTDTYRKDKPEIKPKKKRIEQSPHVATICFGLNQMGVEHETEYRFDKKRLFKFDIAIPALKLGIEYEGTFSAKSRHTSVVGYANDCEKYNLATVNGWKVLRYTALNYRNVYQDIHTIINNLSK